MLSFPGVQLMRTVAGGWFISFTRVACCPVGQSQYYSHYHLGRVQKEAEGNLLDIANLLIFIASVQLFHLFLQCVLLCPTFMQLTFFVFYVKSHILTCTHLFIYVCIHIHALTPSCLFPMY
jgi:hypothetical protein